MVNTSFSEYIDNHPCILGEGAVIERLRRETDLELDPDVVNSAFVYENEKRAALETIVRQYLDIGFENDLPLLLSTPTWRASRERIERAGYGGEDMNGDNFRFLAGLRNGYGKYGEKVVICGLMSCRGDAYNSAESLSVDDARRFHSWQAEKLADAGVDFLKAATLPALSEAIGLAKALADTGKPYVISFVLRSQGTLLDGTPVKDATAAIDEAVNPPPLFYMVNCTHVSNFRKAVLHPDHSSAAALKRIAGLLANTAALDPEELDNSEGLVEEEPSVFGETVAGLYTDIGMKILGGCCGTDDRHIRCLAEQIRKRVPAGK